MASATATETGDDVRSTEGVFDGLSFFLLQRVPSRSTFIVKIQSNGGRVVKLEKQADHIIADHLRPDAPPGSVSYTFIEAAVRSGELPDVQDHKAGPGIGHLRVVGSGVPGKSIRTRFTAEDDALLRAWTDHAAKRGEYLKGNKIYRELEAHCARHTWQAWRARYVKELSMQSPASSAVALTPNVPARPPTVPDRVVEPTPSKIEVRSEERPAKKRRTTPPKESTPQKRLEFTQEEEHRLYENAKDIRNIAPAKLEEAWASFAESYNSHSAKEWRQFYEEYVGPRYLKDLAEGKVVEEDSDEEPEPESKPDADSAEDEPEHEPEPELESEHEHESDATPELDLATQQRKSNPDPTQPHSASQDYNPPRPSLRAGDLGDAEDSQSRAELINFLQQAVHGGKQHDLGGHNHNTKKNSNTPVPSRASKDHAHTGSSAQIFSKAMLDTSALTLDEIGEATKTWPFSPDRPAKQSKADEDVLSQLSQGSSQSGNLLSTAQHGEQDEGEAGDESQPMFGEELQKEDIVLWPNEPDDGSHIGDEDSLPRADSGHSNSEGSDDGDGSLEERVDDDEEQNKLVNNFSDLVDYSMLEPEVAESENQFGQHNDADLDEVVEPEDENECGSDSELEPSAAHDELDSIDLRKSTSTMKAKAALLDTQDIVNAKTQVLDFLVELPDDPSDPDSDSDMSDGRAHEYDQLSHPATEKRLDAPLNEEQDFESFYSSMLSRGFAPEAVIAALKRTSMRPRLAQLVLLSERHHRQQQQPPSSRRSKRASELDLDITRTDDLPGVWSAEEDAALEGGRPEALRRLDAKHGWDECQARMRYLAELREVAEQV